MVLAKLNLENKANRTVITPINIRDNVGVMNFVCYGFRHEKVVKPPSCFKFQCSYINQNALRYDLNFSEISYNSLAIL
jgi:hypothetical protein